MIVHKVITQIVVQITHIILRMEIYKL